MFITTIPAFFPYVCAVFVVDIMRYNSYLQPLSGNLIHNIYYRVYVRNIREWYFVFVYFGAHCNSSRIYKSNNPAMLCVCDTTKKNALCAAEYVDKSCQQQQQKRNLYIFCTYHQIFNNCHNPICHPTSGLLMAYSDGYSSSCRSQHTKSSTVKSESMYTPRHDPCRHTHTKFTYLVHIADFPARKMCARQTAA